MKKKYVLDSNVLIHMVRQSPIWKKIDDEFDPFGNLPYLSVATIAEVISFGEQKKWGTKKMNFLKGIFHSCEVIEISKDLVSHFVEIDVFSQGKHPTLKLSKGMSARNMGKNDIWIAATTKSIEGAELITTDRDFEHLDGVWFGVNYAESI
ncbi:MAG: type II toxin-antitoxin system VapC family toxin [Chitinophagales bacterium]